MPSYLVYKTLNIIFSVVLGRVLVDGEKHVVSLARVNIEVFDFKWLHISCIGHDHCHFVTLHLEATFCDAALGSNRPQLMSTNWVARF